MADRSSNLHDNVTPAPDEPQPSRPTQQYGAPHIGTDIPAWDDQPAAWRNAFGSAR